MKRLFILLSLATLVALSSLQAQPLEQPPEKHWIFFRDKGQASLSKANINPSRIVSERSLRRRAKRRPAGALLDVTDLPVNASYLRRLEAEGITVLAVSRWLNGVSVWVTRRQLTIVGALPFVRETRPVARRVTEPDPPSPEGVGKQAATVTAGTLDYGASATQIAQLKADSLHALGIAGKGVLIGMLDTGFDTSHESFSQLDLLATWDFINNDPIVSDQGLEGNPITGLRQSDHGTSTLGTLGGFREGQLIGPAYNAQFALGKTEIVPREISAEEDNWVRGIEWLDSLGVDIVSSSLGYADTFEDRPDYVFAQLDGKTAVTTIAAEIAFAKGILVVNSAGNEGGSAWNHIITPADGINVLAIGAINALGQRVSFSSPGPSADGRTKPDLMAMGQSVWTAVAPRDDIANQYRIISGTSFSCPLTAGVAAQILSAHPTITNVELRQALIESGDRFGTANVNNLYGFGLPDPMAVALRFGPILSNEPAIQPTPDGITVTIMVRSGNGLATGGVQLNILADPANPATSPITTVTMSATELAPEVFSADIDNALGVNLEAHYYFTVTDGANATRRWPDNAPVNHFTSPTGTTGIADLADDAVIPEALALAQNYPNPFNPSTTISFALPRDSQVSVRIYDVQGRLVRTLTERRMAAGRHSVIWNGTADTGVRVVSGVYFYQLIANGLTATRKMLMLF